MPIPHEGVCQTVGGVSGTVQVRIKGVVSDQYSHNPDLDSGECEQAF